MSRVLAVDPGEVRIGLAISDPLGVVARPLTVIEHNSRADDARRVAEVARLQGADLILVGVALDQDGRVGAQARRNMRLVEALKEHTELPVQTWDESGTTRRAIEIGGEGHELDARAAAVMLQDYLDAQADS